MKKNCLFAALAALLAVSACFKVNTPAEVVLSCEYRYTFSLDENTKALFDENRVVWEDGNLIGAYAVSQSEVSANRSGAVHRGVPCTFTLYSSIALTTGDAVYAYAPWTSAAGSRPAAVSLTVPAVQRQDVSGFDADALPLVALPYAVEDELEAGTDTPVADLQFANVTALVRVSIWSSDVSRVSETVQSVRFDSQEGLSGTGILDLTAIDVSDASSFALTGCNGTSVTTAVTGLSGIPAAKAQAHIVLMGVNPGSWSGTITVVTEKADYVFTLDSPISFERSKIRPVSLDLAHAGDILVDEQVGFDVVRAAAGDGTTVLTNRLLGCRAYLEGLVIGGSGNPNMDQNL
ncbi:MAG: hypothetical protein J6X69_05685, partial [Bacteroidales bacterium]|nr:hypothetical protein [Bacteroidales bacterium]